jgi:hypothetical protein
MSTKSMVRLESSLPSKAWTLRVRLEEGEDDIMRGPIVLNVEGDGLNLELLKVRALGRQRRWKKMVTFMTEELEGFKVENLCETKDTQAKSFPRVQVLLPGQFWPPSSAIG